MLEFQFDLTELADVGNSPRKLAASLVRQIQHQLGRVPLPIPLREIATAVGIRELLTHENISFEGTLVALPDRSAGIISVRSGLPVGRRNFTIGHEIGHFVNVGHRPPASGFQCSSALMWLLLEAHLEQVGRLCPGQERSLGLVHRLAVSPVS